jgi:hypothetical protein
MDGVGGCNRYGLDASTACTEPPLCAYLLQGAPQHQLHQLHDVLAAGRDVTVHQHVAMQFRQPHSGHIQLHPGLPCGGVPGPQLRLAARGQACQSADHAVQCCICVLKRLHRGQLLAARWASYRSWPMVQPFSQDRAAVVTR